MRTAYERARAALPQIEVPSRLRILKDRLSVVRVSDFHRSRADLSNYWRSVRDRLKRGRIDVLLRLDRIVLNALREVRVAAGFFVALAAGNGEPKTS
jgi:hypothetical protein